MKLTFNPRVQTLGPGLTHGPEDGEADGGSVLVRVAELAVARHVGSHQAGVGLRQELGQNLPAHYIHPLTKCRAVDCRFATGLITTYLFGVREQC